MNVKAAYNKKAGRTYLVLNEGTLDEVTVQLTLEQVGDLATELRKALVQQAQREMKPYNATSRDGPCTKRTYASPAAVRAAHMHANFRVGCYFHAPCNGWHARNQEKRRAT